jgi:transposase-like protein
MGRATQSRRVNRYTLEFKLGAVQMSKLRGVQIQDVAKALDIHPFMFSRWRKEAREGRLRGKHFAAYSKGTNLALIRPDVAAVFPTA